MIRVMFVCLGNICRSPMAEAVMRQLVKQAGLEQQIAVESTGTGNWHIGKPAHRGTLEILRRHNIPHDGRAQRITHDHLRAADYVVAMDSENVATIRELDSSPETAAKLVQLLDFAPSGYPRDVPDPYYTGHFDEVYDLVTTGCEGLLRHIRAEHHV